MEEEIPRSYPGMYSRRRPETVSSHAKPTSHYTYTVPGPDSLFIRSIAHVDDDLQSTSGRHLA
jgi:hypothetical protein